MDDSFTRISESALLNAPGVQPLRKQLLEDALKYYQGFVRRLGDRPGVQADLAAALDRVARITAEIGSKEEALAYQVKARGIYQSLLTADPGNARLRRDLARSMAAVGMLRGEAGRREEAVVDYQQALAIQRALADANRDDLQVLDDMAYGEMGLADVLRGLGRREEAIRGFERALAIRERLAAADPDAPKYRRDLALTLGDIGTLLDNAGRHEEASRSFRRAIAMHEALVAAHPEVARLPVQPGHDLSPAGPLAAESRAARRGALNRTEGPGAARGPGRRQPLGDRIPVRAVRDPEQHRQHPARTGGNRRRRCGPIAGPSSCARR